MGHLWPVYGFCYANEIYGSYMYMGDVWQIYGSYMYMGHLWPVYGFCYANEIYGSYMLHTYMGHISLLYGTYMCHTSSHRWAIYAAYMGHIGLLYGTYMCHIGLLYGFSFPPYEVGWTCNTYNSNRQNKKVCTALHVDLFFMKNQSVNLGRKESMATANPWWRHFSIGYSETEVQKKS